MSINLNFIFLKQPKEDSNIETSSIKSTSTISTPLTSNSNSNSNTKTKKGKGETTPKSAPQASNSNTRKRRPSSSTGVTIVTPNTTQVDPNQPQSTSKRRKSGRQ